MRGLADRSTEPVYAAPRRSPRGYYQMAGCEARLGDWDAARRTLEEGEASFPGDAWFLSAHARLFRELHEGSAGA